MHPSGQQRRLLWKAANIYGNIWKQFHSMNVLSATFLKKKWFKLSSPTAVQASGSVERKGSSHAAFRLLEFRRSSCFSACCLTRGVTVNFIDSCEPSISDSHISFFMYLWSFVTAECLFGELFSLSDDYPGMSVLHQHWSSVRMSTFLREAIKDTNGSKCGFSSALHQWLMQHQNIFLWFKLT